MRMGWIEKSVGDILQLEYGKPLDESDRKPNGHYPVYGANGARDRTDKFYHDKPSIIIGRKGSAGEINLTEEKFWPLDVTYFVTFDESQHDLRFLYYLLTTLELTKLAKGVKPGINRNEVYSLLTRVPPLEEQQRIVSILDEAFAGLASAQAHAARNLQNARALFESHLQAVFTQRGEGWIEKPLKVLTELITKGSSPRWQGISYVEKPGVLFITSENVGENQILLNAPKYVEDKFNEKDKKSILRRGDVLTNIVGASIGRTAVYDRDEVANINQAVCLIRCMPDFLLNRFLAYYFNSPLLKDILHAGEVNMARANLSLGFFAELPVAFPSIARQSAIVEHLDALSSETQHLTRIYEQKLAALAALKKSLLHQAFSGEL